MIRVAFSPSGSRRAGTKENNRVFEVQLLDHKVHEKLLVIISQEQEILHTLSTARAKFLEQAYPFRVSSHDVIFHRLLTHFEPSRIEGERLLVGLNFFFFSFFSLLLVSSLICLRSNSPWMDIYIYISAFPILRFLDLCSLNRVDFFSNFYRNVARPWEFKGDTISM